jgi:hypothetical protein
MRKGRERDATGLRRNLKGRAQLQRHGTPPKRVAASRLACMRLGPSSQQECFDGSSLGMDNEFATGVTADTGGEFTRLPEARQTANSELARWVFRPTTPRLGLG